MKGPDGLALFRTIQVGLACEECLAKGIGGDCPHNTDEIPPWKSKEKFDFVKTLYGDRKDLLLRESVGSITEDQSSLLPTAWVERFLSTEDDVDPDTTRYIIVACDPNGGGDSQMAIISSVFHRGRFVLVGADSFADTIRLKHCYWHISRRCEKFGKLPGSFLLPSLIWGKKLITCDICYQTMGTSTRCARREFLE